MLLQMAIFYSSLWLSNISLCVCVCVCVHIYIYYIFFSHSAVDGHLGCFHVLALVFCLFVCLFFGHATQHVGS